MNVGIVPEAAQLLFWEHINWIFGTMMDVTRKEPEYILSQLKDLKKQLF
jgi:hypothetical protein